MGHSDIVPSREFFDRLPLQARFNAAETPFASYRIDAGFFADLATNAK
jgi:hypothetical protein